MAEHDGVQQEGKGGGRQGSDAGLQRRVASRRPNGREALQAGMVL